MYQPYPYPGQGPVPKPSAPPRPVRNAVVLMYVGAALCAVWILGVLTRVSTVKIAFLQGFTSTNGSLTSGEVNGIFNAVVGFYIVLSAVFAGLWIWMAWANRRGLIWARIVSTVFFGLFTLLALLTLIRPQVSIPSFVTIVSWLVGLGAIILSWNSESSAYYQAMSGHFS